MNFDKILQIVHNFPFKSDSTFNNYIETLEIDNLTKSMLKEVSIIALNKLDYLFPPEECERFIISFIMIFLSKPLKDEVIKEKQSLLEYLISNTNDKNDTTKYSSGKLSFLIVNLIYFMCSIMIYFLLSIVILQFFENLKMNEIEKLLIDKVGAKNMEIDPDNIKVYFAKKIELINPKLKNSEPILDCCLPYIFEAIKDLVQNQSDTESVVISEKDIKEIIKRLMFLLDPNNFFDILLTLKIKDY
jgi:hypothetical protein